MTEIIFFKLDQIHYRKFTSLDININEYLCKYNSPRQI